MIFDSKSFCKKLTEKPGVYCMLDAKGKLLYVGKAKNLKKRVSSYFKASLDPRIAAFVSKIADIKITVTNNEKEALLLESSLIKTKKPHYNILFRDDKSYPYIFISKHKYPRLIMVRKLSLSAQYLTKKKKLIGDFFGPYPSAGAVSIAIDLLQKQFKIRHCEDYFFQSRVRPCLQYQINRCSAPCVNYISEDDYKLSVKQAKEFLSGNSNAILTNLIEKMQEFSKKQDFESAAIVRDEIAKLRNVTASQDIYSKSENADVLAIARSESYYCILCMYIRDGKILDTKSYIQHHNNTQDAIEVLRSFIIQHYLQQDAKLNLPNEIIISEKIQDPDLIANVISDAAKKKIQINVAKKGQKNKWLALAFDNAKLALNTRIKSTQVYQKRLSEFQEVFNLQEFSQLRIECFDISHSKGEANYGSCVVFNHEGAVKKDYRTYSILNSQADDYAAINEVLIRRYSKRKQERKSLPEVILIDGGKGQLKSAVLALVECQFTEVIVIAIAKGPSRKPGLETIYIVEDLNNFLEDPDYKQVVLRPDSKAMHFINHIRDESHRVAIGAHRKKRLKKRVESTLEQIPGIGAKKRQDLLNYFGGMQELTAASKREIAKVPGIGDNLAGVIYEYLHAS